MKALMRKWRFLPHPVGALYQNTYLIRRALFATILPTARGMGGDVLDFGCGSKPYRPLFTNCSSYTGVDLAVSGHNHADSDVDVYYDGQQLPFEDRSFDGVVAFEVFEHVFNIDAILSELVRVLKPQGELLLTMPFAWPEHEAPYDFARYTSFGIKDVLKRNGFVVLSISKSNGTIEAVLQIWLNYLSSRIFQPLGAVGRLFGAPVAILTNISALVLAYLMPSDDTFYSNLVVHARRDGESPWPPA